VVAADRDKTNHRETLRLVVRVVVAFELVLGLLKAAEGFRSIRRSCLIRT
jgi:hypothetical protein